MSMLFSSRDEFEEPSDEPISFAESMRRRWKEYEDGSDEADF